MTLPAPPRPVDRVVSRLRWVDATRGVAIVLVVLGHSNVYGLPKGGDSYVNPTFVTIYAFHMPLFIVVSGYLASRVPPTRSARANVVARTRSLLLPYVSWTVIGGMWAYVLGSLVQAPGTVNPGRWIVRALIYPANSLWFLWVLFVCHVLLAALRSAQQTWQRGLVVAVLIGIYLLPLTGFLAIAQLKWLFPFFLAGYLAPRVKGLVVRHEVPVTAAAGIGFAALLPFWQRDDSVYLNGMQVVGSIAHSASRFGYRYAIAFLGLTTTIGIVRALARRYELRVLVTLGLASLGIYAMQAMVFPLLGGLPSLGGGARGFLYSVGVATLVVGVSWLGVRVLERWRFARIYLLGGR